MTGGPRGVAVATDGTIYVGLEEPQAIIAIDPKSGAIRKRVVLDSASIAATKELVTMRISSDGTRLFVANGSDESATILSLPDLGIVREITIEGEPIRDAIPDPRGRFLYLLGRSVHVYDADGETELHTIDFDDPMAIAASANGGVLAVVGATSFGENKATVVATYDTKGFKELSRDPLQTDKIIQGAMFAANDRVLLAFGNDRLYEKAMTSNAAPRAMTKSGSTMHTSIEYGDLVNSQQICLPESSGPQIGALAPSDQFVFAERRCSSSGSFNGSDRRVVPLSLYGISAYALAWDRAGSAVVATDRAGYVTIYHLPRPAAAR